MGDLGGAVLTLGPAVGGGSGALTLRLTHGIFSGSIVTTATTRLELAPDEQRFLSPALSSNGVVSGTGTLVVSSSTVGSQRLNIDTTNTHSGGTIITSL
jgi:hypothetical protein